MLNFGQQLIFNIGLWSAMFLTASSISAGALPVGKLQTFTSFFADAAFAFSLPGTMAFVSSLLFQLAIPLNMLGSVYRETRLNLVDLEKVICVFMLPFAQQFKLCFVHKYGRLASRVAVA